MKSFFSGGIKFNLSMIVNPCFNFVARLKKMMPRNVAGKLKLNYFTAPIRINILYAFKGDFDLLEKYYFRLYLAFWKLCYLYLKTN